MDRPIRILLVDDNPADRALAKRAFSNGLGEFVIDEADSRSSFLSALDAGTYDVRKSSHESTRTATPSNAQVVWSRLAQ